jgi:hypothetical protein
MPMGQTPDCFNHKTQWKGPSLYHLLTVKGEEVAWD